jgi:hypothetical protein
MWIPRGTIRLFGFLTAAVLVVVGVEVAAWPTPTNARSADIADVELSSAASTMPTVELAPAGASPEALATSIAAAVDLGVFDTLTSAPGDVCLTCIGVLVDEILDAFGAGAFGLSAGFTRILYATATVGAIAAATGAAVTATLTTAFLNAAAELDRPPGRVCFTCIGATLVGGVSNAVDVVLKGLASGVIETADAVTDSGAIAADAGHAVNEALTSAVLAVLHPGGERPRPGDYCLGCIELVRNLSAAIDNGLDAMAAGVRMAARALAALSVAAARTALAINTAVSGALEDALRTFGRADASTGAAHDDTHEGDVLAKESSVTTPGAADNRNAGDNFTVMVRDERIDRGASTGKLDQKNITGSVPTDDAVMPTTKDRKAQSDTESTAKDDEQPANTTATSDTGGKPTNGDDATSEDGATSSTDATLRTRNSASSSSAATE